MTMFRRASSCSVLGAMATPLAEQEGLHMDAILATRGAVQALLQQGGFGSGYIRSIVAN